MYLAKRRTRSSSAFRIATPSGGSASISSRFAAAIPSIESKYFDMCVADVRDDSDLRARNPGQIPNLACVIHPELQHRNIGLLRNAQQRKRQPKMIVEIAGRLPYLKRTLSRSAMMSLVLVLPALPVTAISGFRQQSRAPHAPDSAAQ